MKLTQGIRNAMECGALCKTTWDVALVAKTQCNAFKFDKVSISPTFYEQLFHTKLFFIALLYVQFGFLIFLPKNLGTKAACKMLVTLTTTVVKITKII